MKKILLLSSIILLSVFITRVSAQQKIKEGKIKMSMSYPDSGETAAMASFLPSEMVIYFKNGDSRTEAKMSMGEMIIITSAATGDIYTLMNMMGQKMAMKMTKEEMNKMRDSMKVKKPEVKITDETKMIAGIKCYKAIVTQEAAGEKNSFVVWFTKEIDNIDMGDYKVDGIDGFAMEMTTESKGITVHMLCTSFEKTAIADNLFKVPSDYEVKTMDELMKGKPGNDGH